MYYLTDFRVRIINFYKKHKKKIFIIIIIWAIVILINNLLKNRPKTNNNNPVTTYKPHVSVLDDKKEVPEKYQKTIENILDTYFNHCNNKEYEEAYNMITEACRKNNYPTLDSFKQYVDYVYGEGNKIYYIQDYSIIDNKYVYTMRILDDILATGTSGGFYIDGDYYDGYYYYEEKVVLTEENGEMKLAIAQYVDEKEENVIVEDEYIVVKITKRVIDYDTETFSVEIQNKTDNYVIISDGTQANEIKMNYSDTEKSPINQIAPIIIRPNSFAVRELQFNKYYDDGKTASSLIFGAIRIFKEYNYNTKTTQEDLDTALKMYSVEIPVE